ncbi:alpha/beta fold hydrolase [Chitinophaga agrisoli]|uniref:Alpha/beta fold hydrolase n=1 Tax=Chitinophaga agrisoli TaxID=2607653 RepID=A0A5B2VN28_9BACT|nr:proline iminopeptidase-family hydrolase [Chitinophaga agrisoli]KAA2240070.1 alpha/beta fold hydrolase [Chitinophaga agrisoli]
MKTATFVLAASSIIMSAMTACNQGQPVTASSGEELSLKSYFTPADSNAVQTGGVQTITIETPKGKYNVWTKRIGNNPKMKVLLLSGGPGASNEYMQCFESFLPKEGIEMIYYDQLGCGNSDNPKDTALWDLPRYVDEVEQVRQALHLDKDNFFLLGHSWGGVLAMEYALKYQDHLKGLIISNMMASGPDYDKYAKDVLAKTMDPKVLDTIQQIEAKGDFENPKYMELLMPNFYAQHILRLPLASWPDPVTRAFSKMNQSLYVTMQGPSEFGISGKLEHWDVKERLKTISIPTLTIGGKYDTMDPEHMKWMAGQVQHGTYLFCANGSHLSMYDDQATYMNGVVKFIKEAGK